MNDEYVSKPYEYKSPTEQGFFEVTLTRKQHNELFPNRKTRWFERYEYYLSDNCFKMHRFTNWIGITIETVLLPLGILLHGIMNTKEILHDHKRLRNQKKYGSFVEEAVWNRYNDKPNEKFDKILLAVRKK